MLIRIQAPYPTCICKCTMSVKGQRIEISMSDKTGNDESAGKLKRHFFIRNLG